MTTVARLIDAMESIAPPRLAGEWDNTGLLLGDRHADAGLILLTIDLTEAVVNEAIERGVDAVVAYHPPLFRPIQSLTADHPDRRVLLLAARHGIAIYSPHSALDAVPGGMNDWLLDGLPAGDRRAITPAPAHRPSESHKLVTFCPADACDRIRDGLASVGAGRIGAYRQCSFMIDGTGTFRGGDDTDPAVGERGRLERVDEVRLEMVCPAGSLPLAVATLREVHPYEEPPIEIYALTARPERTTGEGRRLTLDRPAPLSEIIVAVKKRLGVKGVKVAPASGGSRKVKMIGVCVGSGGSLLQPAIAQGCDLFITGEMSHHEVLGALARDCAVILPGHTNTERGYLKVLQKRLSSTLPDATIAVARRDKYPLAWK